MKKNGILFRVASGLLAAALTLSLTACGGSSSNSDASAAADSGATHLRLIYSPSLLSLIHISDTTNTSFTLDSTTYNM